MPGRKKMKRKNYNFPINSLLGLNLTRFFAGMGMISPVLGLRPFLCFVFLTSKLPKPEKVTFSPLCKAVFIPEIS